MANALTDMLNKYNLDDEPDQPGMPGLGLDLSRVSPKQLAELQAQDPGALQRGVARFAGVQQLTPPPQAPQSMVPQELIEKYMMPDTTYSTDLKAAQDRSNVARESFNAMLEKMSQSPEEKPSKSEMYFRLAQAFGTPTRTGSFFEGMSNAGQMMSDQKKAEKEAALKRQGVRNQFELKRGEMNLESAQEAEKNARELVKEENKSRREAGRELIKEYINSGKPQSEAGKIAVDSGLQPGTPQYADFVSKYVQDKIASGDIYKQAMLTVAQGGLQLRQDAEKRTAENATKLTAPELKLKEETENAMSGGKSAYSALMQALELNPNTFDTSLADKAQLTALEAVGSDHPKVIATRTQANLLGSQALSQLKSYFGSAPTEGERAILMSLQGIDAKSKKEREVIMKNAVESVKSKYKRDKARLTEINAGAYRTTQQEAPAAAGLEE